MGTTVPNRDEPIRMHVNGRVFCTSTKTTFKQDMYLWDALSSANLDSLIQHFDEVSKDLNSMGRQVVLQAYKSGALFRVLGGVLEEEGKAWTPAEAEANAIFFENLTDPEDKAAIRGQMVAVILHFFVSEAGLRATFQKSSNGVAPDAPASLQTQEPSEGQKTSDSGTTSSENSQDTTPQNTNES
jgi:hypothetical protein